MIRKIVLLAVFLNSIFEIGCFAFAGYTGQSLNATNLYYMRARYYDPTTGSFMSKDPMGIQAGMNSYVYTAQNPINLTDPTGTNVFDPTTYDWNVNWAACLNVASP